MMYNIILLRNSNKKYENGADIMAKAEANFDRFIDSLLKNAEINADYQGSNVFDIDNALKSASKKQTNNPGFPEYVAVINDYVLVIENKSDRNYNCLKEENGDISLSVNATENYAVNGAVFYSKKIIEQTSFKKIFAFGCSGDNKHHIIQPVFVDDNGYKFLDEVETFENFNEKNIDKYFSQVVNEEVLPEDIELEDVLKKAAKLHEHLRNYGSLGETEKPLVVSGILLALREKKYGFLLNSLTGDTIKGKRDGDILFSQLKANLQRANVSPEIKKEQILHQFNILKDRPELNKKRNDLGGISPLKYFTQYIDDNIFKIMTSSFSHEDYLGRFYGEFVRYSGGDGQSLGVVLTPSHITKLFCDLVDLKSNDVVFDPCCGTAGFLIAAMHTMLAGAKSSEERKHIKQKQLYGIEKREDMFTVATTNMILRGDGQSNLLCGDFLGYKPKDLQLKQPTVGFMNPPYSQAKDKSTAHLSEISFTEHLLDSLIEGGRCAVIVPTSAMIGKTKNDKAIKASIYKHHTLEGVISLNKNTFYGVGTVPCIVIFTAGEPHPKDKEVKFINFEDDGFVVKKHKGLVETELAKDKKAYLLDCWFERIDDVPSKFMVKATVKDDDEWLHSFYYYNDEIPKETDFEKSIADYLTFEFNMITHGRGYLFEEEE